MEPVRAWWSAAADLVVGADCAGCGAPGLDWCASCARACRPAPQVFETARPDVPGVAAGQNAGAMARVLVAWKDRGRHRLGGAVGHLLACSAFALAAEGGWCALVPVPTAPAQVRRRGRDPVLEMARDAAALLSAVGVGSVPAPVLRRTRRTRDQVGLSVSQRRANVAGAFALRPDALGRLARQRVSQVIVVDDIWTTGASAREAVRALEAGGVRAAGVAVVAATPPVRADETR